jgi:hypothetical protein
MEGPKKVAPIMFNDLVRIYTSEKQYYVSRSKIDAIIHHNYKTIRIILNNGLLIDIDLPQGNSYSAITYIYTKLAEGANEIKLQ